MARRKKAEKGPPKREPRPPKFDRPQNAGWCPACGEPIVWMRTGEERVTPCHPQRRLMIFDEPYGTPEGASVEAMVLLEEPKGRVILGRAATKGEASLFQKVGNPGAPYAIGRDSHFISCGRLDRWLSGEAKVPRRIVLD